MVSKKARKSDPRNWTVLHYDQELQKTPPVLVWKTRPNSGGIQVAVYVYDPIGASDRRPATHCGCNLFGGPKRKWGPHHEDDCERWAA